MSPNIQASIKARLLNRAKETGEELELFLVRYACERFLYRLGVSRLRDRWILKGAALLTLWMDDPYRATRDLDLLALEPGSQATIRAFIEGICAVPCPEDGLTFDLDSLDLAPIRSDQEDLGQRVVLRAYLGKARIRLQIDIGFGDAVSPEPESSNYPTLITGLPEPRVLAYPRVVTVAEKFDAMVQLGRDNSRMKDFHDIWALSSEFAFAGPALRAAIVGSFAQRGTAWSPELPEALGSAFYADAAVQARWSAYRRSGAFRAPPPLPFEEVGDRVRLFLGPVRDSIVAGEAFERRWEAGGPWQ